jgi:hypothetical protein
MKISCVIERIAGRESKAKIISLNSITINARNNTVTCHFPWRLTKKSCQ